MEAYPMAMETQDRIAQWEKMTQEAPDDMSWFSLGNAYKEADRLEDADRALAQAIQLNPELSRAYQIRGQVLIQLGRNEEASQLLPEGYRMAAARGDVMPQKAIGSLLEKLGLPVPEIQTTAQPSTRASPGSFIDRRTGQPGTRMPDPPMRGPLGRFICDHFSQETWKQWIMQGTKVINELRLDFSNQEHQKLYDLNMKEWLQITDEEVAAYTQQQETGSSADQKS